VAAHFTAQQSPAARDATIDKWMTYRRNARRASNFS